jgi:RHS repeat-associated protein
MQSGGESEKTINGVTTEFFYDGINPVQELSGGSVAANLLTGLGVDERFTRTDAGGTRNFLTDALGSAIALADSAGTIQTEYTYDAFGKMTFTGSSNSNPYQYTGRENDGTGLYYYRARYYHPELQRFISEDPIGFSGGGANFYPYVNNNSINFSDPLGLFVPTVHNRITRNAAAAAGCPKLAGPLARMVALVDFKPESQATDNAHWHGMCSPKNANDPAAGQQLIDNYIQDRLKKCKLDGLADALHAAQDRFAKGHSGCRPWNGPWRTAITDTLSHLYQDSWPGAATEAAAQAESQRLIEQFKQQCECVCQ